MTKVQSHQVFRMDENIQILLIYAHLSFGASLVKVKIWNSLHNFLSLLFHRFPSLPYIAFCSNEMWDFLTNAGSAQLLVFDYWALQ